MACTNTCSNLAASRILSQWSGRPSSKQREAAHELMASIVNSIPDGVHSVDASGVITAMNPSARQIYGYPDAEIVGRTFEILLPPRIRDQVRRLHDQALCGEIVQRFPTVQVRSDG